MSQIPIRQMTDGELVYSWFITESDDYENYLWDELDKRKISNKDMLRLGKFCRLGKIRV